ncbi:MAG: hypothetical protein V9E89_02880 [Ilumatobacteraceae bacterium]
MTAAQRRVIAEIEADLAAPHPMHRLLQGDVGAGKTLVAVSAMLTAVEGGHQAGADGAHRGTGRATRHRDPPDARRRVGPP